MIRIACLFLVALFCLSACTNADKTAVNNEEISNAEEDKTRNSSKYNAAQFPEIIELTYSPIPLIVLEESTPDHSLEYLQSFSLGSIQDNEATLHVYKEHDESKRCGLNYETTSFVNYDQQIFQLSECTSINFLNQDPGYFLQLYQLENSYSKILQAGIELASNGAGRTLFIIYDRSTEQWLSFEDWGAPVFNQTEQANADTFPFYFPGLHMKGSDVAFYRWNNGNLEKSDSVSNALGFSEGYYVNAELVPSEIETVINVKVLNENNLEFEEQYKHENNRLIKNHHD